MSKENKIKRAEEYINKNEKILKVIDKLCNQYSHNHTCAKNLFDKAQVKDCDRPSGYSRYDYGYIIYEVGII